MGVAQQNSGKEQQKYRAWETKFLTYSKGGVSPVIHFSVGWCITERIPEL